MNSENLPKWMLFPFNSQECHFLYNIAVEIIFYVVMLQTVGDSTYISHNIFAKVFLIYQNHFFCDRQI